MKTEEGVLVMPVDSKDVVRSKEQIRLDIVTKLAELGVESCPNEIIQRLAIIEENSEFNHDSEMICEAFGNVLSVFEVRNPLPMHLSPKQKQEGLLAAFLHDIGKSGGSEASLDCQLSVIKLFSVKNVSPDQLVEEALSEHFPSDHEKMLEALGTVGVTSNMTMRQFWDKHAWWTHEVLLKYPDDISDRVNLIASSHHINAGINPCKVPEEEIPYEATVIGALEHYVDLLEERMLMVIDKYQAILMRGGATHETAMTYLRGVFQKYKGDLVTDSIIEIIDELGKTGSLFPNTHSKYKTKVVK